MEATESKAIDLSFIKDFSKGNPDKIEKYISMFISAAPALMDKMRKANEEEKFELVRTAAHSLKPQGLYMGAKKLYSQMERIEKLAEVETNYELIKAMINESDKELINVINELKTYLNK